MALALPKPLATTGLKLHVSLTPAARNERDRMFNPLISNEVAEAIRAQSNAAHAAAAASHRMSVIGHAGRSAKRVKAAR
jgi:hypothetical protein